jgi:hypothetical protein
MKVYYTEYIYGEHLPNNDKVSNFNSLEAIIQWLESFDNTPDKDNIDLLGFGKRGGRNIGVNFFTNNFGGVYMIVIHRIVTEDGIIYNSHTPEHKSKVVIDICKKYADFYNRPLKFVD